MAEREESVAFSEESPDVSTTQKTQHENFSVYAKIRYSLQQEKLQRNASDNEKHHSAVKCLEKLMF